jgi:hypothetical protein
MHAKTSRLFVHLAVSAAASLGCQTMAFAGDVSVSVNLNAPGLYGQITIGGDVPAPELILPRPVVAVAPREVIVSPPPPLYLHVPPGHERHWAKHCREYNACGRPVYFVSDRWYHDVYTPRHFHGHEHEERREEHYRDEHDRHEHEREIRHEEERYHDHDHDRDHDHGHGHDRDDKDHDHR